MLLAEGMQFADRERFELGYGYFLPWKDALVGAIEARGGDVICFEKRSHLAMLRSVGLVADHLRAWRADILHCHLPLAGCVGRLAARRLGIPVVYTEHNTLERYHWATRALSVRTYPLQAAGIAVSDEVLASIRRHVRSDVPMTMIPNAIDVARFDPARYDRGEARAALGLAADVPVIGTVAVFRTQKALHDWLDAAALLRARIPNIRFVLAGDGPLRDDLRRQVVRSGLGEAVLMPGLIEDVPPVLAALDIYMMSSRFEGLPLALLEAMAMECAVVATPVGGIPEVVEEGVHGHLVGTGDPQGLASAVAGILDDPEAGREMGRRGRVAVDRSFSLAAMTRRLEAVYDQVGVAPVR